ncbi:MAG: Hsp20/alpha crystallin family protein [Candidatus Thermoplasmatota archaeon]|nr:Hsp20/alpha crystallin family protein [Candidatus Thermoplasmatota archaeon]
MAKEQDNRMVPRDSDRSGISPFGMWEDLDDLFNSFRRDMDRMFWSPLAPEPMRIRVMNRPGYMPMNLEDKGENFLLTVELPGVKKEDAKISLDEDVLSICVESNDEKEEKEEGNYLFRERRSYSCSRSIRLPQEIDGSKVSAKMVDGVLHIELPKMNPREKVVREINIE